jgi:hypothetical protein
MLQANNLALAVAIILAAYGWRRSGYRTPGFLRLPARIPRLALAGFGWALVAGVIAYDVGGVLAGRTQIAKSGRRYAWRERDPVRFWREIGLQTIVIAGTGVALVVLARRPAAGAAPADA